MPAVVTGTTKCCVQIHNPHCYSSFPLLTPLPCPSVFKAWCPLCTPIRLGRLLLAAPLPFSMLLFALVPWGWGRRTSRKPVLGRRFEGSLHPYPYLVLGGVTGVGRGLAVNSGLCDRSPPSRLRLHHHPRVCWDGGDGVEALTAAGTELLSPGCVVRDSHRNLWIPLAWIRTWK